MLRRPLYSNDRTKEHVEVYFKVRRNVFIMHHLSRTVMLFSTIILGGIVLTTTSLDGSANVHASEIYQPVSNSVDASNLKPGIYDVTVYNYNHRTHYTPGDKPIPGRTGFGTESVIAQYFKSRQQVTINTDGTATIKFQLDPSKKKLATFRHYQVGPELIEAKFDEQTYSYTITMPTKQLNGVINTLVDYLPAGLDPTYAKFMKPFRSDLYFVWSSAEKTSVTDNGSGKSDSVSPLPDGVYQMPINHYKPGTNQASMVAQYYKPTATVTVKNGRATIDTEEVSTPAMKLSDFTINGVAATKSGTHWSVSLPVSELSKALNTKVTLVINDAVRMPAQTDLALSLDKAVKINDSKPDSKPIPPISESTRELNILQKDSNEKSMAATYMLPTVKLAQNADGFYYAYITTHTPAMMGQSPITFSDTKHATKVISNKLVDGYYQSVIRLTLTEAEISAPIATNIHVEFTQPLTYKEDYIIRLMIGKANDTDNNKSSSSSSQSAQSNGSSSSENAKSSSQSSKISSSASSEMTNSSSESSKISSSSSSKKAENSSTAPITKPDTPKTDVTEEMRRLTIMQSDNDKPSMAATYMLPTIKLVKNADGSYFAFVTTHTPELMGQSPITFNDVAHDAKVISTELVNGFYQSVIRLTLSPSELSAPIVTNIHVMFTQPMSYDNYYSIRLIIGDNADATSTSATSNPVADHKPTVVAPNTAISTAGTPDTTSSSTAASVASIATTDANAVTSASADVMPQSAVMTPQHTVATTNQAQSATQKSTSEKKQPKIHVAQKQLPTTNSTNHQAQVTVTAGHSKMNAVMIALGASIATAFGFVGTSLGLNVWRNHQNND